MPFPLLRAFFLLLACVLLSPPAFALRTWIESAGRASAVDLETVSIEGVSHVYLAGLAETAGGSLRNAGGALALTVAGKSANGTVGSREITAGGERFRLQRPLVAGPAGPLICVGDAPTLFASAFGQDLRFDGGEGLEGAADELGAALLDLTDSAAPSAKPVVVLDPGHGGSDTGAVGFLGGLQEKEVCLALSRAVQDLLAEDSRLTVALTRTEDLDLPASARARFAQREQAQVFISIHGGANYSRSAAGCRVYYYGEGPAGEPSALLAASLAAALEDALDAPVPKPKSLRSRVLLKSGIPGAVVEVGRLTHAEDESALSQADHRNVLAAALAEGIQDYLTKHSGEAP